MEVQVDTILALAIHATSILDENNSARWLSRISTLTQEEFNQSRQILGIIDPRRRNTVEVSTLNIVQHLQLGKPLDKQFVIDPSDLGKLPGLSRDCLELTDLQLGIKLTKVAINHNQQNYKEHAVTKKPEQKFATQKGTTEPLTTTNLLWNIVAKKPETLKVVQGIVANPARVPPLKRTCLTKREYI